MGKGMPQEHENAMIEAYLAGSTLEEAVAQVLYKGATIYLDRKYDMARKLCGDLL